MSVLFSYLLIIVGVAVWIVLLSGRHHISDHLMQAIAIFGSAFLLASCFINLVPHIFIGEGSDRFVTGGIHFKLAASVLIGFLIQLLLEHLTRGIEHGHNHCECCNEESHHSTHHHHEGHCHEDHSHPVLGLMIGLCVHAFLEGMPLVAPDGDVHQGLLYGIVLHNVPIAIVMVSLFMSNRYSVRRSILLLLLFAIMTPLGSLCNLLLIPADPTVQSLLMGLVVGILLHVSSSMLFDHDHNSFSWFKFALIVLAFVAAYFTPGCPEIYPV